MVTEHMEGAMRLGVLLALSAAAAGAGCTDAARAVVDKPSEITLKEALTSTVDAIYAAKAKSADLQLKGDGIPLGANICTISAVFNIAASGVDSRSISGTLSTPKDLYVSAAVTGSRSDVSTASRGNQVTVTFTSPACNPVDTLGTKSPGDVVLLEREIEAAREGLPDPIRRERMASVSARPRGTAKPTLKARAPGGGRTGSGGSTLSPASTGGAPPAATPPTAPVAPAATGDRSSLDQPSPSRGKSTLDVKPATQ